MRALILFLFSFYCFGEATLNSLSEVNERIKYLKTSQENLLKSYSKTQVQKDFDSAMELTHEITILESIKKYLDSKEDCENASFAYLFEFNRSEQEVLTPQVKHGLETLKKLCQRP